MFSSKIIDFSSAEIYKLKTTQMSREELESFLREQNLYTMLKFAERFDKMKRLKEVEGEIQKLKESKEQEKKVVHERLTKTYTELRPRREVHKDSVQVDSITEVEYKQAESVQQSLEAQIKGHRPSKSTITSV